MRCKAGMMSRRYLPPGDVVGLVAVRGDNNFTLSWTPPSDNGGLPVTGYVVTVLDSENSEASQDAIGNVTSYTAEGLSAGSYTATVKAANAAGTGTATGAVSAVVGPRLLASTLFSLGAIASGVGSQDSPLTITAVNGSSGAASIALANTQSSHFVTWSLSVTSGTVQVRYNDELVSVLSESVQLNRFDNPSNITVIVTDGPASFVLTAYR